VRKTTEEDPWKAIRLLREFIRVVTEEEEKEEKLGRKFKRKGGEIGKHRFWEEVEVQITQRGAAGESRPRRHGCRTYQQEVEKTPNKPGKKDKLSKGGNLQDQRRGARNSKKRACVLGKQAIG